MYGSSARLVRPCCRKTKTAPRCRTSVRGFLSQRLHTPSTCAPLLMSVPPRRPYKLRDGSAGHAHARRVRSGPPRQRAACLGADMPHVRLSGSAQTAPPPAARRCPLGTALLFALARPSRAPFPLRASARLPPRLSSPVTTEINPRSAPSHRACPRTDRQT